SAQHVVGIVTVGDVVRGYRRALETNLGLMSQVAGGTTPVEARVSPGAAVAGRAIRDAGLPAGTIVVTVERDGALLFPGGATVLEPGDVVSALVRARGAGGFRRLLGPGGAGEAAC
ncbi:MAG: TrkA C-terminal domain-containing protein, partial [Acidimicrobiales bacterium]